MAQPDAPFVDVSGLWGPGWQATSILRTERGAFLMTLRRGPRGLEHTVDAVSRDAALRQAGEHAATVETLLNSGRRQR